MGDSPVSDTILGTPPTDQRCTKNDGKLWRCAAWKMEGRSLCQRHFLKQAEYKTKKKSMPTLQHPTKRKTPLKTDVDDNMYKKKKKVMIKKKESKPIVSDDDSIDKLFEDNYPTDADDDSIDKLFDDDYTTSSDDESCQLIPRRGSSVKTTIPQAKDEVVEELSKSEDRC